MNIVYLIGGLILILLGANFLTDGGSALAKRFRISNLVIGLTIVAFGTSAPEFVVSVFSAIKGSAGLAVGNIVGSNIFNALLIVGCAAAIVPISVTKGTIKHEIPLCILASLVIAAMANDSLFDGTPNVISRTDGIVLLGFFCIFLGYTFAIAHQGVGKETVVIKEMPLWKSSLWIVGGLACLIFGGKIFVSGATGIARSLNVSETVIGLTIVAGGTSLPELATSVVAALKKNPEMAIGNVLGSNIFNIFFILGCASVITPLPTAGVTNLDFGTLILSSVLLFAVSYFYKERSIRRSEGIFLLLCYIGYIYILL